MQCAKWQDICVGDLILCQSGEAVPADMILLATAREGGVAFVETAGLDGETNLKLRSVAHAASLHISSLTLESALLAVSGLELHVTCDAPNNEVHTFSGFLALRNQKQGSATNSDRTEMALNELSGQRRIENVKRYPAEAAAHSALPEQGCRRCGEWATCKLYQENILLRGSKVRNTQWIVGMVVYAGADTKLLQVKHRGPSSSISADSFINRIAVCVVQFVN